MLVLGLIYTVGIDLEVVMTNILNSKLQIKIIW